MAERGHFPLIVALFESKQLGMPIARQTAIVIMSHPVAPGLLMCTQELYTSTVTVNKGWAANTLRH